MPLYEALVHTVHYERSYFALRNLISSSASFVRSQGGAVRGVQFSGTQKLNAAMKSQSDKSLHNIAEWVFELHSRRRKRRLG